MGEESSLGAGIELEQGQPGSSPPAQCQLPEPSSRTGVEEAGACTQSLPPSGFPELGGSEAGSQGAEHGLIHPQNLPFSSHPSWESSGCGRLGGRSSPGALQQGLWLIIAMAQSFVMH